MKRSEMIKVMAEYYYEKNVRNELNDRPWKELPHAYVEAILSDTSKFLDAVEKLGMLPPFSNQVFQKNARKYIEPSGNEWDPEDETK